MKIIYTFYFADKVRYKIWNMQIFRQLKWNKAILGVRKCIFGG